MINWFVQWWYARERQADLKYLWPACKQQGCGMDHAKAAFALHAYRDKAWQALGDEEMQRQIGDLT